VKGFNFKCKKIQKEKSGIVIATDQGAKLLLRSRACIDAIMYCHDVKEFLFDKGIITDRFHLSAHGLPYLITGGETYLLTDYYNCPDGLFADSAAFLAIISELAKIHSALKFNTVSRPAQPRPLLGDEADKSIGNLRATRKKLLKTGRFTDFDMMFLKGLDFFGNSLDNWIQLNNGSEIMALKAEGIAFVCHNLLKEENINNNNGKITIINFAEASPGHYIYDLAYIIKRYILSAPPALSLHQILESYTTHNEISRIEIKFLRELLLFPDKFIKIADSYYFKKRPFVPKAFSLRMEEIIRTKEDVVDFCADL